jgi:hypothetical protein
MSGYSEYTSYYEDFKTGYWADSDARVCRCKGHGWTLSEVDTWHRCPFHGVGKAHPDDEVEEEMEGPRQVFSAVPEVAREEVREEEDENHIPF